MKKIIMLAALLFFSTAIACAKQFKYNFHSASLSEALTKLAEDHPELLLNFIYNDLDSYKTSASIDTDDPYVAIINAIGLNSVEVVRKGRGFYIQAKPISNSYYHGVLMATDGKPVVAATVILVSFNDSTVLNYGYSDENGRFCIPCKENRVLAKINCLGYKNIERNLNNFNVGTIIMQENVINLKPVTVKADRKMYTANSETFILTDSIRASASNAAMMLGKLPGIKVDLISEDISVEAHKSVPIIVDGKTVGSEYAKSLNPKRIKSVQILRFPPGEYSDQPVVINLILFSKYTGWDSSTRLTGRLSFEGKHSNTESFREDATFSTEKWNTYASAFFRRRVWYEGNAYVREIDGLFSEETNPINLKNPNREEFSEVGSFSLGVDRKVGKSHIVSFQTWLDYTKARNHDYFNMNNGSFLRNNDDYTSLNSISGIFYRGSIGDKLYLSSSLQYNNYHIDEDRLFSENQNVTNYHIDGKKDYIFFSAYASYSLTQKWSAAASYNYTWRRYGSGKDKEEYYFNSKEERNKIEALISFRPVKSFNILAGGEVLGISNCQNDLRDSHTSVMPKLQMYWHPIRPIRVTAVYLNWIDYPNLDQLSTSEWQISDFVYQIGNPGLNSRIVHYLNFDISLFDFIKLTYMWRHSTNDIVEWYEMQSSDKVLKTFTNCNYLHQYAGIQIDKEFGKRFGINFLGNYQRYSRWKTGFKNHGRTWYADLTGTWNITDKGPSIQCEYFLRHDLEPLPQGIRYFQEELLALGIHHSFFKGHLPVSLKVTLPAQVLNKQTYTKIKIPGFRSEVFENYSCNNFAISLNVRYNIGKGKVKKEANSYVIDSEK